MEGGTFAAGGGFGGSGCGGVCFGFVGIVETVVVLVFEVVVVADLLDLTDEREDGLDGAGFSVAGRKCGEVGRFLLCLVLFIFANGFEAAALNSWAGRIARSFLRGDPSARACEVLYGLYDDLDKRTGSAP